MKKLSILLALLMLLTLLPGCGQHEHEWQNASCTEPETCSVCGETRGEALGHRWRGADCTTPETCARCGETRGEPLGHDWQEADCTTPETCSRCGETQGEPLGHQWQDASCTEPEICSVCGETRGEPLGHDAAPADYWSASVCSRCGEELEAQLTPDFVSSGLDARFMEKGKTYNYRTICHDDNSLSTVGKATVTRYDIVKSEGEELEARDGYEWRIVTFEVVFDDDNANEYGMSISNCLEDYYDVRSHDDSLLYDDSTGRDSFDIVWKGQTYRGCSFLDSGFSGWKDKVNTFTCSFYAQVPVGYDGIVVGLRNRGVPWPDDAYILDLDNSDTLFFRMS